jgi:predicted phosphoribosyltransferase
MIACLRSIRKQRPRKIIIAVPVISAEALEIIRPETDDLVCLRIAPVIKSCSEYFEVFQKIDQVKVRNLLDKSRKRL